MKTSKTNKASKDSKASKTGQTSKPSKAGKAKRMQGPPYLPNGSPEERAAGKAAFDRIIEQMLRPMVQYREMMERVRIIAEEAKATYEAEDTPPYAGRFRKRKICGEEGP